MFYNMKITLVLQILVSAVHFAVEQGTAYTTIQISGQFYKDLKFSVPGNSFKGIKILATLDFDATLRCGRVCASTEQCQAYNLYKNESAYFCEMLPANTRVNQTQIAYVPRPGAVVWEKMPQVGLKPFLDEQLKGVATSNYCPTIKPGCLGTWPNCTDCVKSCIDCYARNSSKDSYTCTLWPGPTAEENTPITTTCYKKFTHLMRRTVNLTNGQITDSYIMPFRDMNRLCRLNAYSTLQFFFEFNGGSYKALYSNPYITENGTLMNLRLNSTSPQGDGLNLGTGTLPPTPFVNVSDDKYSCGSFWLFDKNNATYCPGGGVGFFGTPIRAGPSGAVIDSGINWPLAKIQGKIVKRTDLALYME